MTLFSTIDKVSCGNHRAKSCAGCPQGNGATWCSGDCQWVGMKCIYKESDRDDHLDRYIYFNPGKAGWRIGDSKSQNLSGENEGRFWYQSHIQTAEFWLEKNNTWIASPGPGSEVKVECFED